MLNSIYGMQSIKIIATAILLIFSNLCITFFGIYTIQGISRNPESSKYLTVFFFSIYGALELSTMVSIALLFRSVSG